MASHAYPSHPPTGGKGLPPPAHYSQAPHPPPIPLSSASGSHIQGQPPDLEHRFKLKVRYLKVQKKYFRSLEIQKNLELELAEKEAKQQKLQDEVDLILDQIHQSDYAHLRPKDDDLFSEDEEAQEIGQIGGGQTGVVKRERGLEDEEQERRNQLEEDYGIDSAQPSIKQLERIPEAAQIEHPAPKRIKLTFGSNGATSNL